MCRFVSYLGSKNIAISDLIDKPSHSLIKQSHAAKDSTYSVNGDGFGMAWYSDYSNPGIFKTTQPAWNDNNLIYLAREIQSYCFLAHIRASTIGDVSQNNCHPFCLGPYCFVHNGTIKGFADIKRNLLELLEDDLFLSIKGQTDSECLFILIMHFFRIRKNLENAVLDAFSWVVQQQRRASNESYSQLNIVITDGKSIMATRYTSKEQKPLSLSYTPSDKGSHDRSLILASEVLSECADRWEEVPINHYVMLTPEIEFIKVKPLML